MIKFLYSKPMIAAYIATVVVYIIYLTFGTFAALGFTNFYYVNYWYGYAKNKNDQRDTKSNR